MTGVQTCALPIWEIDSLKKEFDSETKQLAIVEKEAKRVRDMASRGLTNAERVMRVDLTLTRVERARQSLKTAIIRSRLALHREQRRKEVLKVEAAKKLRDEQQATLSALKEARVLQRRSEQLVVEAEISAPRGFRASLEDKVVRKFAIIRATGDKTEEMGVQALAVVKPGDVITVEKIIPISTIKTSQPSPSLTYGANQSATVQR